MSKGLSVLILAGLTMATSSVSAWVPMKLDKTGQAFYWYRL